MLGVVSSTDSAASSCGSLQCAQFYPELSAPAYSTITVTGRETTVESGSRTRKADRLRV